LSSSVVHVVGVGLKGALPDALRDRKWIYFAEPELPFYRVTVLSNFAPSNAPSGHWSLLAEIAHSRHRPVATPDIVERVVGAYRSEGLVPADAAVASRFHHVASPGYPTPTLSRDAALAELHPALEKLGIYSRGRFGAWRYEIANQDHSFLQGAELVGRLLLDEPEPTFTS
jgi:protoporphyrinogen oxidase